MKSFKTFLKEEKELSQDEIKFIINNSNVHPSTPLGTEIRQKIKNMSKKQLEQMIAADWRGKSFRKRPNLILKSMIEYRLRHWADK